MATIQSKSLGGFKAANSIDVSENIFSSSKRSNDRETNNLYGFWLYLLRFIFQLHLICQLHTLLIS